MLCEKQSAVNNTGSGEDFNEVAFLFMIAMVVSCKQECAAEVYHKLITPIT